MALGTTLPFWPALVFTYLEPISLLFGYHAAFTSPTMFVTRQLPDSPSNPLGAHVHEGAVVLSYTLGNIFLLLAGLAVLCTVLTRDARVTKWYLFIVGCADLGHIYSSYKVMGSKVFFDFAGYNDMMLGNIVASAFLHVNRLLTLLGLFGKIGGGMALK